MRCWWLLLLICAFRGEASTTAKEDRRLSVVGYLPEYRMSKTFAWMKVGKILTDLVLFSLEPGAQGEFSPLGLSPVYFKQAKKARQHAREKGLTMRLLVCVGGEGRSAGFKQMFNASQTRQNFIKDLTHYLVKHDLDGVDYDLEVHFTEKQLAALLDETRQAFQESGKKLMLTMAFHPGSTVSPATLNAIDRVHLMTYDYQSEHGHSNLDQSLHDVRELISLGVPAHKLTIGIAAYGRKPQTLEAVAWRDMAPTIPVDALGDGDMIKHENALYSYNSRQTVADKLRWASELGLSGVILWEVGQDVLPGEPLFPTHSLLHVIAEHNKHQHAISTKRNKQDL